MDVSDPPQMLIDAFRVFTIPERIQEEFGYLALTPDIKNQILGANAARLYHVTEIPTGADPTWLADTRLEAAQHLA